MAQGTDGRDHNPFGFTIWLAGGGIKGGTIHGATDDYGYHAVENKVEIHDLHATMLHLLGIDHKRLTVPLRRPRHAADRRARRGRPGHSGLTLVHYATVLPETAKGRATCAATARSDLNCPNCGQAARWRSFRTGLRR